MSNGKERIVLGSGKLYVLLFTGNIPEDNIIEQDANLIGAIQGGASLEYKMTTYTAVDDSGKHSKTIITDEEAVLKSGVMTWNGNTLKKLVATARVNETELRRTVKIGGIDNQNQDSYLVRFVHEDKKDGDIRVTLVGKNQAGLTLAFVKNKETVVNAEFKAEACDDEGTLIIYEEEIVNETPET